MGLIAAAGWGALRRGRWLETRPASSGPVGFGGQSWLPNDRTTAPLDDPGIGPQKYVRSWGKHTGLLLLDLIGTVLHRPLGRRGLAEPVRRGPQLLLHLMYGK